MKDFRLFNISELAVSEDFIWGVYKKRKLDNDFRDKWLSQNPDKYIDVTEANRILELIGVEQKASSECEKQQEIKRLMNKIKAQGT
jgi:hypothetical protein